MNGACIHLESAGSASLPQATSALHRIYLPIVIPLVCIRSTRYASMRTEKSAIWHHNLSDTHCPIATLMFSGRHVRERLYILLGTGMISRSSISPQETKRMTMPTFFICARWGYRDTCVTFYTARKRLCPSPSYLCTTSLLQSNWSILCMPFM